MEGGWDDERKERGAAEQRAQESAFSINLREQDQVGDQ